MYFIDYYKDNTAFGFKHFIEIDKLDYEKGVYLEKIKINSEDVEILSYNLLNYISGDKPSKIIFNKFGISIAFHDRIIELIKDAKNVSINDFGDLKYIS